MDLNQFSTVDIVLDKANDNFIQKQTISAGDRNGRSLTLQVTDAGSIGEVPGLTANLLWTNHSSGVSDLSAFSVVDRLTSVFKIDYPQNMLAAGKVTAQIQLLHNGKVTHSKKFEIIVLDIAGKLKGVLQTAEYTALVEALAKTNGFDGDIRNLELKKADVQSLAAANYDISELRNKKVDKNGNEQIGIDMLSQEVKEIIAGSNTLPAVKENSVNTSSIINKAVTSEKVADSAINVTKLFGVQANIRWFVASVLPIYDPKTLTLDFRNGPETSMVYRVHREVKTLEYNTKVTYSGVIGTSAFLLLFNPESKIFRLIDSRAELMEGEIWVGTIRSDGTHNTLPFPIEIKKDETTPALPDAKKTNYMHLSIDDVIEIFNDITTNDYDSIFDNPVLSHFKSLNDNFGAVFSMYCFYKNGDETFNLSMMSNKYKKEFTDSAHWLKWGVHYYKNGTDNFGNIETQQAVDYYNLIITELHRICGAHALDYMPRLHNYAGSTDFIERVSQINLGIKGLITAEDNRQNYHLNTKQNNYMQTHDSLYDADNYLKFASTDLRFENVSDVKIALQNRLANIDYASRCRSLVLFTHENQLVHQSMLNKIKHACEFAAANNYRFDYPLNN